MERLSREGKLGRALLGADQRLADPACREVLTDLGEASGRTLKEVLDGTGVSARTYLRWILFFDGRAPDACKSKHTIAATDPGSRVVFICPLAFVEIERSNPEYAEATLIHEMLHSLGLGENPPRSGKSRSACCPAAPRRSMRRRQALSCCSGRGASARADQMISGAIRG